MSVFRQRIEWMPTREQGAEIPMLRFNFGKTSGLYYSLSVDMNLKISAGTRR